MRIVLFESGEKVTQTAPHGSCPLGAAARNHGSAQRFGKAAGNVLGYVNQRTDQPEIFIARMGYGRQGANAPGKQRVAQERLAEIVGGVSEGDDIGFQIPRDLINGAPPVAATQITAMAGLFLEQPERRLVVKIRPIDSALLQIVPQRLDRPEKLALLHGERAD